MPVEFIHTWAQIELSKVANGLVTILFGVEGHTVTWSPGYLKAPRCL